MILRTLKRVILGVVFVFSATIAFAEGGIKGVVKYEGKVPRMKPIKMAADPICDAKHDAPVRSEWLIAGENGELKNVFVYIKEGVEGDYPAPSEPETIDQDGCVYKPHVIGVQIGQPLEILNSDGTLHNVHAMPKKKGNERFNVAMPAARKKITKAFNTPEVMVRVKCDVHPWMGAYVGVVDHPFFAVTGDDGTFEIKGLLPGTYTIEAWHEKLPAKTATITIKKDETAVVDFVLKRSTKKKK